MSLKDEIDEIIRIQRQKLEEEDRDSSDRYEIKRKYFSPMNALIEESFRAVGDKYIDVSFLEIRATIEVGRRDPSSSHFKTDIRWEVELDRSIEMQFGKENIESELSKENPIRIDEICWIDDWEYGSEKREGRLSFRNEHDAMKYLVDKITKRIALYKHQEENY